MYKPLPLLLPPNSIGKSIKWCSQNKEQTEGGDDDHEIGEKARSTAEEFGRVARDKERAAVPVSQTVDDAFEGLQEAVLGESNTESVKNKESAERRRYENVGKGQD
ncbi:hypothetical protein BVC80_205g71 [Macleaya cordata]|uniref:Uncharacterized protein n=1 Tax=Macleaya cordata TaxID=56857 RepID=A0A200PYW6_MACCD|nr:hypothetical protein BVC80_205g71 [Macleaya cordata]